jgi:AcrR family transcriptional regulator
VTTDWTSQATPGEARSRKGHATRERIVLAATALYAAKGIDRVAPHEILEASGQRNASAIQYYFGSHEGLVVATLQPRPDIRDPIEQIRTGLLDDLASRGESLTLEEAVRAWARPVSILLETPERRAFVRVAVQVLRTLPLEHRVAPNQPSDRRIQALVHGCLAHLPDAIAAERMGAAHTLMLELYANRAREIEDGAGSNLELAPFTAEVVSMMTALLAAPVGRVEP